MEKGKDQNTIQEISRIEDIMDGDVSVIKTFTKEEANQKGYVINPEGEKISEITPAIMMLNQSEKGWHSRFQALVDAGTGIDERVNYYNKETTARELLQLYRGGDYFLN